ncbi:MAG: hypothetical protein ACYDAK_13450 [Candidatus Limnocylindrales bacterium]
MIVRDARGSLVHVRRRDDGACVGCIEAGLYEITRTLIAEDVQTAGGGEGKSRPSPATAMHDSPVRSRDGQGAHE